MSHYRLYPDTLQVHWLMADAPLDPTKITDPLDPSILVPLGYSTSLIGTLDLLDLDLDPSHLQLPHPLGALGEEDDEIFQALRYLNCSNSAILVNQTTSPLQALEHYSPFLGWKPLEVIKRIFEATT